jgi:hypothetical protein
VDARRMPRLRIAGAVATAAPHVYPPTSAAEKA